MGGPGSPAPADAGSFELREGLRTSVGTILTLAVFVPFIGGAAYLLGRFLASLDGTPWYLSAVLTIVVVLFACLAVAGAAAAVTTVTRMLRRSLVVAVDRDGMTFGPDGLEGLGRTVPWSEVVRLRTYVRRRLRSTNSDGDPSYHEDLYVQAELRDGSRMRRLAPGNRRRGVDLLVEAVGRLAPGVRIVDDGDLPPDTDPYA